MKPFHFPGETESWTAAYLAALSGGHAPMSAEAYADDTVRLLDRRVDDRVRAWTKEVQDATDRIRVQRTYCDKHDLTKAVWVATVSNERDGASALITFTKEGMTGRHTLGEFMAGETAFVPCEGTNVSATHVLERPH